MATFVRANPTPKGLKVIAPWAGRFTKHGIFALWRFWWLIMFLHKCLCSPTSELMLNKIWIRGANCSESCENWAYVKSETVATNALCSKPVAWEPLPRNRLGTFISEPQEVFGTSTAQRPTSVSWGESWPKGKLSMFYLLPVIFRFFGQLDCTSLGLAHQDIFEHSRWGGEEDEPLHQTLRCPLNDPNHRRGDDELPANFGG